MKATEVRVRKALDPGESYVDPAFVLVETALGADGDAVTTIEHLSSESKDDRTSWRVVTLGQSVPMSHLAALEWAVSYAASRGIPVVYERDQTERDDRPRGYAATSNGSVTVSSSSK
jgi:hypothetical protein